MPNGAESPLIPDRLDSWKAIAAYLRRDERTVRRWEKTLGLPVRRVPGGRGASVFAYVSEIEAWLQRTPTAREQAGAATDQSAADHSDRPPKPPSSAFGGRWWWIAVLTAAIVIGAVTWRLMPSAAPGRLDFKTTDAALIATDESGAERWRYPFPGGEKVEVSTETPWAALDGGRSGVYVLLSGRQQRSDSADLDSELLKLGPDGQTLGIFAAADKVTFGVGPYGPPWALLSFRIDEHRGARRIAIVGHHRMWSPGIVTVLDDRLQRQATFVNGGWLESVRWISPDRLLVTGFSNGRDAGMMALLDVNAMNGHSPEPAGSLYDCQTCGPDPPLRYVVFPRSELNLVTHSRFNRARLSASGDRVLIRTEEVPEPNDSYIDAIYEFSPGLELLKASYSDRYWDLHRSLELQGLIRHTRAQCPDRDGPREIQEWDPASGWRTTRLQPVVR